MDGERYTIRQMSEEFGVTARALRFYEDKGLLSPLREGQTRVYTARDRARLVLVLRNKRLGFSLDEIRQGLDLYDRRDGEISQLRSTLDMYREQIEHLERQKQDIDAAMTELEKWSDELNAILDKKLKADERADAMAQSSGGFAGSLAQAVRSDDRL